MHRLVASLAPVALALLVACGGAGNPVRSAHVRQALTGTPELLELEPVPTRQEMFREVARTSLSEAGHAAHQPVLFPVSRNGELIAAPGFDAHADLLQPPTMDPPLQLRFGSRADDRWPEDRRDSLQGLSEREAAELVARSLLSQWGIQSTGPIEVNRAAGAPYAVAYADGILQVNPSFLYLVAAAASSFASAP